MIYNDTGISATLVINYKADFTLREIGGKSIAFIRFTTSYHLFRVGVDKDCL